MSLIAHKIIEALIRQPGSWGLDTIPGIGDEESRFYSADLIRKAEKFDMVDFNPKPSDREGHFQSPQLTEVERGAWADGLLPSSAPICWYECRLGVGPICFLVVDLGEGLMLQRFDQAQDMLIFDSLWVWIRRDENNATPDWRGWVVRASQRHNGRMAELPRSYDIRGEGQAIFNVNTPLYFILMINSRSTELRTVPAPPPRHPNAKRKIEPLSAHRVVTIVPTRYLSNGNGSGGHHQSPRLHWRRSHVRRLASGSLTLVSRALVGRADLGEITHEYRVRV